MRESINITRLPTSASEPLDPNAARSTYHIYPHKEKHRRISSTVDFKKESPLSGAKRRARKQKKALKESSVVAEAQEGDPDDAFFLQSPYLAFHSPPKVLYIGSDKHAVPVVLIHGAMFWKKYRLQYGPSIAAPGVVDPRGVVSWKHNGGDKATLKADDRKLKGYKVRTWRLWGETGKAYVQDVRASREAGTGEDPDSNSDATTGMRESPALADGVVYLEWEHPFSRHTRRYHFHYNGIDFYWKGTGTVNKSKYCGIFVCFNHLKLVARLPPLNAQREQSEICLAKYISSVTSKKCGRLDIFDSAILCLVEDYLPPRRNIGAEEEEDVEIGILKKSPLYSIILATALCMIAAEKEKREAVGEWLEEVVESGGG